MHRRLCGLDTEYGLMVEGLGPADQIEASAAFVRSSLDGGFLHWNYAHESPRQDLRGFAVERLAVDPEDAKFDAGRVTTSDRELRSDRVLPNGARFYNDHGHPEYATPEAFDPWMAAAHDLDGEEIVWQAAQAYATETGKQVKVYKNNTDFHGASYGTHESYLFSRGVPFEQLANGLIPTLIARQWLTGAGKVGSERGAAVPFQISQRADFFSEPINVETLYRRPVMNTRDEPHASPLGFRRLHVISGDSNRMAVATARKMWLVNLTLRLIEMGEAPQWTIPDPVRAFAEVSRDLAGKSRIGLEGANWTTAREILSALFGTAEKFLELSPQDKAEVATCRKLLESDPEGTFFRQHVDWAAKRWLVETYASDEGLSPGDSALRAVDLGYSDLDPAESLYEALLEMGEVAPFEPPPAPAQTRAYARGLAVKHYSSHLTQACWRSLTFGDQEIELSPTEDYASLDPTEGVESFIAQLKDLYA